MMNMIELSTLAKAVHRVAYASENSTNPHISSVHFAVRAGTLMVAATNGARLACATVYMGQPDMPSVGVGTRSLVDAIHPLRKSRDIVGIWTDHAKQSLVIGETRLPIESDWYAWLSIIDSRKPHAVSISTDTSDALKALRASKSTSCDLVFRRAPEPAAQWVDIAQQATATDISMKQTVYDQVVYTMPGADASGLTKDADIMRVRVQRAYLVDALRRSGKRATIEMHPRWPAANVPNLRVTGDDVEHIICGTTFR